MTSTAIVILNFNGAAYLEKFLPGIISKSPGAQIVVADNASSDNSLEILKGFPRVHVLVLDKNYGFAGGYNKALEQVEATYYLLLNSDVEVSDNWLDPLTTYLDNHPEVGSVQPKILSYNNPDYFEYAGAAGGYLDRLGYPYCRGRLFDEIEIDYGQYDQIVQVDWTSGACMLIRSEVFKQANGFDDRFFAHMEEIDLCWRLKSQGQQLCCVPQSVVFHVGGGTLNKQSSFKTYLNFRNNVGLLLKNAPWRSLLIVLPARFFLDFLAAIVLTIKLSPRHGLAVGQAWISALSQLGYYLKQRLHPKNMGKGLLLWSYYVRRKRRFEELNYPQ